MLKLTPFSSFSLSLLKPRFPLLYYNHFSFKSLHFPQFNPKVPLLRFRHDSSMSSSRPPSAFDKLMSGARAAASKKKTPSPQKRKSQNPNPNPKEELISGGASNLSEAPSPSKKSKLGVNLDQNVAQLKNPKPENPNLKEELIDGGSDVNVVPSTSNNLKLGMNLDDNVANLTNPKPENPNPTDDGELVSKDVNGSGSVSEASSQAKQAKMGVNVHEYVINLKKKPASFDPKLAGWWEDGEKVPFLFLAKAFDLIKGESGRIVITDITCNLLRTVIEKTPEDVLCVVYLLANKIAPAHQGLELGIGDVTLIKALAEACGATEAKIKKSYKDLGDLGDVAKEMRSKQSMMRQPAPLTIAKVFSTFHLIAQASGKDSQDRKKNYIKSLIVAAKDCEPVYLMRLLQSKLRISLAEQTLLVALGQAAVYSEQHSKPPSDVQSPFEEAGKIVKQVYSVLPVYDKVIPALLSGGVWNLSQTGSFTPGVPIGPMLAKPTKGVSEIIDKFQDRVFTCEYKYDGERAQVIYLPRLGPICEVLTSLHPSRSNIDCCFLEKGLSLIGKDQHRTIHYMEDGSVEIYSRNAERNTGKYPDVISAVTRFKKEAVSSFVLDCEIVAYDREKQKILPFQILSTRARKNVVLSEIKVDVGIYAFDILYLNGKSLLQEQLTVRRKHLYDSFEEEAGFFQFATTVTSNDLEEIQKFLDDAVNASCEGLIIKTLDKEATYEPSRRSNNWLKLKKDYMDSVGDSLDLVPIGAFHGRGKRTGVYGAFLLACYDADNEEFQTICKIGTGFSEVVLEERSSSLRSKVISNPKPYFRFGESLKPDVWFDPSEVWEVKAADLTISPVHRAAVGIVDSDKGISLRFPRLLRVREDKTPEEATSSDQVAEMYNAQAHTKRNKNQDDAEDDE